MIPEIQATAIEEFQRIFSDVPDSVFFAPGRVNLIGEHTDYNDGFVLPCAIGYGTYLVVRARTDSTIRVVAGNLNDRSSQWQTDRPVEHDKTESWSDYLRGVSAQLYRDGIAIGGMDIYALGNVPRGAGLSSSASFSVAFATCCNEMNGLNLDKREIARIAQRAENDFAGCNCGIMDQLASAAGEADSALLLDCRNLEYKTVRIPENLDLMIIDSRVERKLVGSEYNDRRDECERAARTMGLNSLREADLTMLAAHQQQLDEVAYRRARHILTENERTVKAAAALAGGDIKALHQLMADSHTSMRDDFEITVPAIDFLVESVEQLLNRDGGVRMTGGGFGGCVVALVPHERRDLVAAHVRARYLTEFGRSAEIHSCHASGGARRV
jgi:galactokinase